jgi:hypothetical protein
MNSRHTESDAPILAGKARAQFNVSALPQLPVLEVVSNQQVQNFLSKYRYPSVEAAIWVSTGLENSRTLDLWQCVGYTLMALGTI